MKPEQQTEYIVQAIRVGACMYEGDARRFLAEHDDHVRAAALAEGLHRAADEIDKAQQRLVVKKTVVNLLRRRANQAEDVTT